MNERKASITVAHNEVNMIVAQDQIRKQQAAFGDAEYTTLCDPVTLVFSDVTIDNIKFLTLVDYSNEGTMLIEYIKFE